MTIIVRLMSDWFFWPTYVNRSGSADGMYEMTNYDTLQAEFSLPDEVITAIDEWDQLFQRTFNDDSPEDSDWEPGGAQEYHQRGREVVRLLRSHLPREVVVEYAGADDVASEFT